MGIYKKSGRWRCGPHYTKTQAWLFTDDEKLNDETIWYGFSHYKDPITKKLSQKFKISTGFKATTLKNDDGEQIYSDVLFAEEQEGDFGRKLSNDKAENLLGSYKKIKKDVYFHAPINYERSTDKLLEDELPDLDMIYVTKNFETDFKNESLPGYYDMIGPSVYLRRDLSTPDYQKVYCYRRGRRWCIGPHLASPNAWAYSSETDEHPSGKFGWYEIFMAKLVKDRELSVFMLLKFRDSKYFAIIKKLIQKWTKLLILPNLNLHLWHADLSRNAVSTAFLVFFLRAIVFVP